jgi:hypothetical protein
MSKDDFGETDRLDETVLMLSSLLLALEMGLTLVGLAPVAACVCSCKTEGVDAMAQKGVVWLGLLPRRIDGKSKQRWCTMQRRALVRKASKRIVRVCAARDAGKEKASEVKGDGRDEIWCRADAVMGAWTAR